MAIRMDEHEVGGLEVSTITLDNPPVNVLDLDHCRELTSCMKQIIADDRSRIVVFRGSTQTFSAGVDIKQHNATEMPLLLPTFHEVFDHMLRLRAITVACVTGPCLGGGAELAFACDRVIADRSARFGFPEINIGCYPPVALSLLPYRAGQGRAVEMILGGAEIEVDRMVEWGMIDRVVDSGKLEQALADEFRLYAGKSPTVLGLTASLLHEEARRRWADRTPYYEKEYLDVLLPHPDVAEGIAAFNEKRKPKWKQPDPLVSAEDDLL